MLPAALQHVAPPLVRPRQLQHALRECFLGVLVSDYALRLDDLLVPVPRLRQQIQRHLRPLLPGRLPLDLRCLLRHFLGLVDLALDLGLVVLFLDLVEPGRAVVEAPAALEVEGGLDVEALRLLDLLARSGALDDLGDALALLAVGLLRDRVALCELLGRDVAGDGG